MSWSDSMSSSMTLTGSRSLVVRPHGASRLARGPPRMSGADPTLRRLVQELNASRIVEEPEDELDNNHPLSNNNAAQTEIGGPGSGTPEPSVTEPLSRRKRVARSIKTKTQRLLHLIAHYMRRLLEEYSAAASIYRPLQYSVY
ncbi:hypothetical protein IWW50_004998 [Coemansia erecta]|nr:hypothetical protein IWW50_004998 [Coemansia erecta]